MNTEKMIYRYKVPVRYLIVAILFLLIASVFIVAGFIEWDFILFFMFCFFFGISTLFLASFLKNTTRKQIELTEKQIKIPHRWTNKIFIIKYADIVHIELVETFDKLIEIYTNKTSCIIERNWMKNEKEFMQLFENCIKRMENK